jgi:hypothetical protein
MKKKSIFNNNEVDIDLLFNQPKHLKKMLGGKKNLKDSGMEESEEDEDDEEEEQSETKSLSPHMKKYINDYIDSKKGKPRKKGIIEGSLDKLDEKPVFVFDPDNYHDKVKKGEIKPVIKKYWDKYIKTKK